VKYGPSCVSYRPPYQQFYDRPDDDYRERRHFQDEGNRPFQQRPMTQLTR
jgi:hypothetical protein